MAEEIKTYKDKGQNDFRPLKNKVFSVISQEIPTHDISNIIRFMDSLPYVKLT